MREFEPTACVLMRKKRVCAAVAYSGSSCPLKAALRDMPVWLAALSKLKQGADPHRLCLLSTPS
jgi:hypothetical protein